MKSNARTPVVIVGKSSDNFDEPFSTNSEKRRAARLSTNNHRQTAADKRRFALYSVLYAIIKYQSPFEPPIIFNQETDVNGRQMQTKVRKNTHAANKSRRASDARAE